MFGHSAITPFLGGSAEEREGTGKSERERTRERGRGGGLGSSTIFNKFNEPYAPSKMVLNDGA